MTQCPRPTFHASVTLLYFTSAVALKSIYTLNCEEVDGVYWFRVVRPCVRACVRTSRTVHARVLKFHIWIPHGLIADTHFFSCPSYLPLWSYAPLKKSEWNLMHAISYEPCMLVRVLKFHIWIPHGKIDCPYLLFLSSYLPFWSYASLKKSEWNLVSKISRNVFELGAWNLVSW